MGDEELSMFQSQQLKWLKQQVDNLKDERYREKARPNIHLELFAAREELNDYVKALREGGKNI
tara:strand:+ start:156 stop:344 length:189 start_codon:yes stop_codon:yes gene_type:complete